MELTQLRYFIRLAEVLNFTEASKQLFITQSTLSQSIRQTESELGTPLFERIGKKVYLTDAGQAFLPYARQSIIETETGIQKLRDMQQIYKGELRIGVIYSLCPMLAESIVRFSKEYPGIKLILTQSTSINDMTTMLHNNEVAGQTLNKLYIYLLTVFVILSIPMTLSLLFSSHPHIFLLPAIPSLMSLCFKSISANFDMVEKLIAALPVFLSSSSLNPTSSTQCKLFSTAQCDLTDFSMVTGSGSKEDI